ncbi:hypothetical protein BKG79_15645 [Mycobacteroides chelonae]|nr:hypothetical protein AOT86_10805 [Mycobacteroides sp. H072]KRQ41738.1 hypothetical protein AOT84_00920 [Mycobacteroides sp. H002]KRQ53942.1 hypothetical protein AOT85_06230 [Mycobacteroides sp. H054]OHU37052.1 hypothetical protein BKG79_15645 [Mycobacteroides chelonae]
MNAAQQALGSALNGNKGGLPEGVLGLGSKGVNGVAKPGGFAGGGGAGKGGGIGAGVAKELPTANPATRMAAGTKPDAAVSRAGLSNAGAAGAPGSGAPAAGQRGAAGGDKIHKASKALHHNKHGIFNEAEAVVQVVGAEPEETTPAKPT